VTDHRIPGLSVQNLPQVLEGDLDRFVDALLAEERREQLSGDGQALPGGR